MSRFRVAQRSRVDWGATAAWLAIVDVARMLRLSREGVRLLAIAGDVPCQRTPSGQWLFHRADVLRLVEQRARRRILTPDEVWRSLRVVRRASEPRQLVLPLFGAARKRKVSWRSPSETSPIVERTAVGLISGAMSPAKVDGRKRMAKVDEVSRPRTAGGHRA